MSELIDAPDPNAVLICRNRKGHGFVAVRVGLIHCLWEPNPHIQPSGEGGGEVVDGTCILVNTKSSSHIFNVSEPVQEIIGTLEGRRKPKDEYATNSQNCRHD